MHNPLGVVQKITNILTFSSGSIEVKLFFKIKKVHAVEIKPFKQSEYTRKGDLDDFSGSALPQLPDFVDTLSDIANGA